jgi:hypothetical protein
VCAMTTKPKTELESALYWLDQERKWVDKCGPTRSDYIARYGSKDDADHLGDGGEAIYDADMRALDRAEQRAMRALEQDSKRRRRS